MALTTGSFHLDLVLSAEAVNSLPNESGRVFPLSPLCLRVKIDILRGADLVNEVHEMAAMYDRAQLASGLELRQKLLFDLTPEFVGLFPSSRNSEL